MPASRAVTSPLGTSAGTDPAREHSRGRPGINRLAGDLDPSPHSIHEITARYEAALGDDRGGCSDDDGIAHRALTPRQDIAHNLRVESGIGSIPCRTQQQHQSRGR